MPFSIAVGRDDTIFFSGIAATAPEDGITLRTFGHFVFRFRDLIPNLAATGLDLDVISMVVTAFFWLTDLKATEVDSPKYVSWWFETIKRNGPAEGLEMRSLQNGTREKF